MHEFEIIKKYFSKLSLDNKNSLKLNDDVFFDKSKELVISVDTYIDKLHFFDFKDPDLVIKKILRSSISDLICKGVKPKYYFISGSGNKKTFTKLNLSKISQSLKQEQKKFGIHISGGDTVFSNKLDQFDGLTDIFIYPGYKFKAVDKLITNFHLPKSTLLMLVAAFIGFDRMKELYEIAIKKRYRFLSYGDAMFLTRK